MPLVYVIVSVLLNNIISAATSVKIKIRKFNFIEEYYFGSGLSEICVCVCVCVC